MSEFKCEKCGKEYTSESYYLKHIAKCEVVVDAEEEEAPQVVAVEVQELELPEVEKSDIITCLEACIEMTDNDRTKHLIKRAIKREQRS